MPSLKYMKKEKQLTLRELKDLYWEFRKAIMTECIFSSSCGSVGGGGSGRYDKIVYKNDPENFLIWLETKI